MGRLNVPIWQGVARAVAHRTTASHSSGLPGFESLLRSQIEWTRRHGTALGSDNVGDSPPAERHTFDSGCVALSEKTDGLIQVRKTPRRLAAPCSFAPLGCVAGQI